MAGFRVAGKVNGGDKYDGFTEKPPHNPKFFAVSTFYYYFCF